MKSFDNVFYVMQDDQQFANQLMIVSLVLVKYTYIEIYRNGEGKPECLNIGFPDLNGRFTEIQYNANGMILRINDCIYELRDEMKQFVFKLFSIKSE